MLMFVSTEVERGKGLLTTRLLLLFVPTEVEYGKGLLRARLFTASLFSARERKCEQS